MNNRRAIYTGLLIAALIVFEIVNFSTSQVALDIMLGPVAFAGVTWAVLFAFALCLVDFAGLSKLYLQDERKQRYLMVAWIVGAGGNALLTQIAVQGAMVANGVVSVAFFPVVIAAVMFAVRVTLIGLFNSTLPVAGQSLDYTEQDAVDELIAKMEIGQSKPTKQTLAKRLINGGNGEYLGRAFGPPKRVSDHDLSNWKHEHNPYLSEEDDDAPVA